MALIDDHVVLKDGELYVVCGPDGDIRSDVRNDGLYFRDMRHLSGLRLSIDGWPLDLLSDSADRIDRQTLYLTNATGGAHFEKVPRSLAIIRDRTLDGKFTERVTFTNHSREAIHLTVRMEVAADFRDVFDVRGFVAADAPATVYVTTAGGAIHLFRRATDNSWYTTIIAADPTPAGMTVPTRADGGADQRVELTHVLSIPPGANDEIIYYAAPEVTPADEDTERPSVRDHGKRDDSTHHPIAEVATSNDTVNTVLTRSLDDLGGLVTPLPNGETIIVAGLPWYVAPFGRDSLIVGRQLLPYNPSFLAGSVRFLASVQGERDDPWRDEQPGRIVHEVRFGDLSRRGVIPFSRYYGTVDATPLFLLMLTEYLAWTGDDAFFDELRPNVERALEWIATAGDSNSDGLIDFTRKIDRGLVNQGWKDSFDSLEHLDGAPIASPVAPVEVQGYVYAAKEALARYLDGRGERERAASLRAEANLLRERINERFWMPEVGYYAEAIDGDGRQLAGVTSNPGHLLACGVPGERQAVDVIERLLSPDMFTGWGIRTLSAEMPHYNPVSYHRGSVWPHDNGFILWGLRRYLAVEPLRRLAGALVDAAAHVPRQRLPELISGFKREWTPNEIPIAYPISCSPQAWAAGVPLVVIETLLGLRADAATRSLHLAPRLPAWLDSITLPALPIAGETVSLCVTRNGADCEVDVISNPGRIAIVVG